MNGRTLTVNRLWDEIDEPVCDVVYIEELYQAYPYATIYTAANVHHAIDEIVTIAGADYVTMEEV